MADVIIIGAGAAGLFAAVSAINSGYKVLILEKMPYAGKKLLITGKGRCNLTNMCERDEFLKNIPSNPKFFMSSFRRFSNQDLLEWFNAQGLETKVERGLRAFPASDSARDVRDVLVKYILQNRGEILYNVAVKQLLIADAKITGVKLFSGKEYLAKQVIVATGGTSYQATGSDGYGYKLAEQAGHSIVQPLPALVPLECDLTYIKELQGLSLKNVAAKLKVNGKIVATEFGEMLFAHFGLTGPMILTLSGLASKYLQDKANVVEIIIDLKPALDVQTLENRIQRELKENSKKQMASILRSLMPASLIPVVLDMAFVTGDTIASQLPKAARQRLIETIKGLSFSVTGTRPFAEAIITAGGVSTKEINPKNMQSKLVAGLYFAGEVIDLNAYTGGFNLQIAFSTGYVAGLLE